MSGFRGARVVHLTSVHRPDDVRIFRKECRTLAAAGYEVVLVASGADPVTIDGVRFHPIAKSSSRSGRLLLGWGRILAAAVSERGALYHLHDPELLPVGVMLRLLGKRVVYDAHENVAAQIRSKHWIPPLMRSLVARAVVMMEWIAIRTFSGVVTAGEDIAAEMGSDTVTVVRNYPLLEEFAGLSGRPYGERDAIVVHVGGLARIRASRELIEAIALVPEELAPRLVLAGSFVSDGLEAEVRSLPGWARTRYLGWSTRSQVAAVLAEGRVGVVLFLPEPNHLAVRSNKVFEYMAAGLPVVAPDFPAWRALIEGEGCGAVVPPTDPVAVAAALTMLLADVSRAEELGRRGKRAVWARYNWEAESGRLLALYARLLGADAVPPADPDEV